MRIELGAPVLVVQLPGGLGQDLYHLPAPGLANEDAPERWASLCGLDGIVYGYNGPLRRRRMCAVCRAQAPAGLLDIDGGYSEPEPEKQRRPGARRLPLLTDAQIRVLHALYTDKQIGITAIGELVWQKLGYPSAKSCSAAIYRAFTEGELPIRPRGESMRRTPEKRRLLGYGGLRPGERKLTADTTDRLWRLYEAGYGLPTIAARFHERFGYTQRRFHDVVAYAWKSEGRRFRSARDATLNARDRNTRRCAGTVKSSRGSRPRPCTQAPLPDSEFCLHHDPRHRERVVAAARAMEARLRREPTVEFAGLRVWLDPLLTPQPDRFGRRLETAAGALARNTGISPAVCSRLLNGRHPRVTVTTANRLLAPVGLTVENLYQREAA